MRTLDDPDLTLGKIVRLHARERPDAPALVEGERRLTYRDVDEAVDGLAAAWPERGLGSGDRVALIARDGIDWVLAALGLGRAGLVAVPINVRLSAGEIAFQLADSGARAVLHDEAYADLASEATRHPRAGGNPEAPTLVPLGSRLRGNDDRAKTSPGPLITGIDPAAIFYTSGTTGRPKGAVLTHRNLLACNQARRTGLPWDDWRADDVCLLVMPLGHIGGFSMVVRTLYFGASGVLLPEFDAGATLAAIGRWQVSKMAAVPLMLQRMVEHPAAATTDFSRLKVINHGAAPIEGALLAKARGVIGCGFSQGYGMTETAGVMASLDPAAHTRGLSASTGRAMPGVELRIAGPDGVARPTGERGEIQVRGPNVMRGYWQRPDVEAIDAEGWFATGDAGHLDDDGYLFIVGRIKDMIVTGGENVYAAEVENAIAGHPAVAEVAVIGIPDRDWGEAVRAVVVPRPGHQVDEADVIAWTKARIARFKAPKSVVVTHSLPRNALGKVLKEELRRAQAG